MGLIFVLLFAFSSEGHKPAFQCYVSKLEAFEFIQPVLQNLVTFPLLQHCIKLVDMVLDSSKDPSKPLFKYRVRGPQDNSLRFPILLVLFKKTFKIIHIFQV